MATGYVYDPIFLEHDFPGHPEGRPRLETIWTRLEKGDLLPALTPIPAQPVNEELLLTAHTRGYIDQVRQVAGRGGGHLDADTYVAHRSYDAALMAAGGLVEATAAVLDGRVQNAFALVRPPGHHALRDRGMGFCLFNNVAVAAQYALNVRGLERVLIVDFDVHHGNGTQDTFYDTDAVLFFSSHQYPFYPGSGHWNESGTGKGAGHTVNVPLPYGVGDGALYTIFKEILYPIAVRYKPQIILVSAGFDAHWSDPLAGLNLSLIGYASLCQMLHEMADELCEGRLVYTLEGGYHLNVLAHATANAFRTLLGYHPDQYTDPFGQSPYDEPAIEELVTHLQTFNSILKYSGTS